jgi:prepilin-type N-terminal cleavage/methylation domain-containing protein
MKSGNPGQDCRGFTLVEAIVTIMVAAIMGVIFAQLMGTAMSRSANVVENVKKEAGAEALVEQIVADYLVEINKNDPSGALGVIKGKDYGTDVSKNYITFNPSGNEVKVDDPGVSDTLKVTVKATGGSLTVLLTNSRIKDWPSPPVAY